MIRTALEPLRNAIVVASPVALCGPAYATSPSPGMALATAVDPALHWASWSAEVTVTSRTLSKPLNVSTLTSAVCVASSGQTTGRAPLQPVQARMRMSSRPVSFFASSIVKSSGTRGPETGAPAGALRSSAS